MLISKDHCMGFGRVGGTHQFNNETWQYPKEYTLTSSTLQPSLQQVIIIPSRSCLLVVIVTVMLLVISIYTRGRISGTLQGTYSSFTQLHYFCLTIQYLMVENFYGGKYWQIGSGIAKGGLDGHMPTQLQFWVYTVHNNLVSRVYGKYFM